MPRYQRGTRRSFVALFQWDNRRKHLSRQSRGISQDFVLHEILKKDFEEEGSSTFHNIGNLMGYMTRISYENEERKKTIETQEQTIKALEKQLEKSIKGEQRTKKFQEAIKQFMGADDECGHSAWQRQGLRAPTGLLFMTRDRANF